MTITVTKLPVDPGPAAWNRLLPDPSPVQSLEGDVSVDFMVIGAGFAGLSAARRLLQLRPGARIAVLEAHRVADGPAGRNSGFMIDLPHDLSSSDYGGAFDEDKALTHENRHAISFAADVAKEFALGQDIFDLCGKINGAATVKGDQHNCDYAAHLTAMGEPSKMLDADAMAAITGTTYYSSGLFTAGTAVIQPAAYIRGIAEGLRQQGVHIFENSPVTALERSENWTATTPQGRVTAPKTILAVNGHLNSFGFLRDRLMHVFTYASMTRVLTANEIAQLGGDEIWALTPADPMGTTVRKFRAADGLRIVVRNRFTFEPSMEVDQRRIDTVARDHDRSFTARFPMLQGVSMEYRWGGRLCISRNNVSAVREIETNLYSACCQNGLGAARGTLSGILAAELATQTSSPLLERALASPGPSKLPPKLIAGVGAKAVLKWQEWKAGAEL